MSSQTPPNPWFNQINYNPDFFSNSSSTGITLAYLNANYLKISAGSNPISSSTTTTFSGQLIATADANSVISISNKVLMSPVGTGVIYLVGVSSNAAGNYNLITDSLAHLSFATGTNSLNVGVSGAANGNMNLYGSGAVLSIPVATGIAINVPNGTINAIALQATNNLTITGSNPIITTTTLNASLNLLTATAGTGTIEFYPQNTRALSIAPATINVFSNTINMNGSACSLTNTTTGGSLTIATPTIGGNIYLNANNIAGITITSTAITNNLNTTLPTLGVVPSAGQLGYFLSQNVALTSLISGNVRIIASFLNLVPGTYILNGSCGSVCTTLGTITQIGCGFSTSSSTFATSGQFWLTNNLNLATQTFAVNGTTAFMNSTGTITLTTATTFYFISTWIGASGAFNFGGSASYTRIA